MNMKNKGDTLTFLIKHSEDRAKDIEVTLNWTHEDKFVWGNLP